MSEDFQTVNCPYCASAKKTRVTDSGQFDIPTHVVLCKSCGLVYLSPRWTSERYNSFYTYEYEKFYPRTSNKPDIKLAEKIYGRVNGQSRGYQNILDVGAGFGDALHFFRQSQPDAQCYAIEPSKICADHLVKHGVKLVSHTVDDSWYESYQNHFDLIIMRHVLEHLLDPLRALQKIATTLTEHGVLYLAVPDALHPISPLSQYYFRAVHICYFNRFSIGNFLSKAGLVSMFEKDNLSGELYVVAKRGITNGVKVKNKYALQKWIIRCQFMKENIIQLMKSLKQSLKLN